MATTLDDELGELLSADSRGTVRVPALVKGQLVIPPRIPFESLLSVARRNATASPGDSSDQQSFSVNGSQVIRRPTLDRTTLTPTGEDQFLILPEIDPRQLIETDLSDLTHCLYNLPFREVMDYVEALSEVLRADNGILRSAAEYTKATSLIDDRAYDILFRILPDLFNPQSLREAVDTELGSPDVSGTQYLDDWVTVRAQTRKGVTARMADQLFGATEARKRNRFRPRVRAMPTRQLHITAGNSPIMPFLSILRAIATKSASVIKSPAENTAPAALLALAMRAVDPNHPITRHTSLVYWKGGDRRMEDVLLASGAFDRLVVWGSPETVSSVSQRAGFTKTVFMNPRYGMSFVGREAFSNGFREVAIRAATDTMIANQNACISSLVHYVEASEDEALGYCRALKEVLKTWDTALPHTLSRSSLGKLRGLRRKDFLNGNWFENGRWPQTTSVVVYMPTEFDVAVHPMCRFVVVRRVDDLREALKFLHSGVATIGVYPESRRMELRDEIAARGVTDIFPLGECERVYAGKPHDGSRVLSELVNWTNG